MRISFRPRKPPRAEEWIPKHVYLPPGGEYDGLFNLDVVPHVRGVLRAFEEPDVHFINLCWATRLAKTTTAMAMIVFAAAHMPMRSAIGGPDKPTADRCFREQLTPMLERCAATRDRLPPTHRRHQDYVDLQDMIIRKAFAGSDSSVAGYPACLLVRTELSKWPRSTGNKEADPALTFVQRTKGYPFDRKVISESSPATIGECRIWELTTAPSSRQHTYQVPCPRCETYQTLDWGDRESTFGIKWERNSDGKTDRQRAIDTAYYQCRECGHHIPSADRPAIMRAGVWVPAGQHADQQGRLIGEPLVTSDSWSLGPLGSQYSLMVPTWGYLVGDFLDCGHEREKLRNFQNSTLALGWNPAPREVEPHQLIARLVDPSAIRKLVPEWGIFLTRGVDVQEDGKTFRWCVCAWGLQGRGSVIDEGESRGTEDFQAQCLSQIYPHADRGQPLRSVITVIDSGNWAEAVYVLSDHWQGGGLALPAKGSSTSKFPQTFFQGHRGEKSKSSSQPLLIVNTNRTQLWLEGHLTGDHDGTQVARFTLPADFAVSPHLLVELANEQQDDEGNWKKTGCNDLRDAVRLAWIGENYLTNHGKLRNQLPPRPIASAQETVVETRRQSKPNPYTSGGGRQWQT